MSHRVGKGEDEVRSRGTEAGWRPWALAGWALFLGSSGFLLGGGPLIDLPDDARGWPSGQPINFIVDKGPLRSGPNPVSSEEGAQIVRDSFGVWGMLADSQVTPVATAALSFEDRGFLDVDVDSGNSSQFLNQIFPGGNPVIFDADGKIIDVVLGPMSSNTVLGFASGLDTDLDGVLDYGVAVLNGLRASTAPNSQFRSTVIHELGHMLGLDHTQAGAAAFHQCRPGNPPEPCTTVPIMFPFSSSSSPFQVVEPQRDDQAWISWIYPGEDFRQVTGTIRGRVRRRSGVPFQGANVEAVPVTVSEGLITEMDAGRVSSVSDFLFHLDGSFELPGLTPGDYVVFIERLDPGFTEGSRVGPFETRFTDFPKDYYNGPNESGIDPDDDSGDDSDDPTEKVVIHVEAGQTVERIDLVSNEKMEEFPDPDLDTIDDDDFRVVFFPPGFAFPFFGKVYKGVFVNSDGNLSFDAPDMVSTPRNRARFLDGPPRIAPLFTDLNPLVGGDVTLEELSDSVRLTWSDVPEFGSFTGNDFSVQLFANGNILFHYGTISVTPDFPIDPENTQAIVGVTPGRSAAGEESDLASLSQPIPVEDGPVFQVFTGSSFNLSGDLLFEAATSRFFLLFPFNRGNQEEFSGFAVVNDDSLDAVLEVEGLANDGVRQDYPDNPHTEPLDRGHQIARLGFELFGTTTETERSGWVRIGSTTPQLASFFQIGNGLSGTISKLDGSVAFTQQSNVLYFTRIAEGPFSFPAPLGPSPLDAQTLFSLANPNDEVIGLTFTYFNPMGMPVGNPVARSLNKLGCLRESFTSLFGNLGTVTDGYVRVEVEGPGAVGFELVELEDTVLGFNASFGNPGSVSYSAQLAHGTAGFDIFTSVKLVNTTDDLRSVTLIALREDGSELNRTVPFPLGARQTLQRSVGDFFQLGPPTGPSTAGSIVVEATGPGVIGDVVFGDPNTGRYAAALPLQTQLFTRAIFAQVANSDNPNPALATFTGLAFFNPSDTETAQITIRVFQEGGALTAETPISLGPKRRLSEVLASLVPESAGQVRGYIEVLSTVPLVAQQLFGDLTLDFLSAVPPTIFE
ncbi:MAG: hypothetical protein ACE5JX_20095 [Acidobacteriota bacterium]